MISTKPQNVYLVVKPYKQHTEMRQYPVLQIIILLLVQCFRWMFLIGLIS